MEEQSIGESGGVVGGMTGPPVAQRAVTVLLGQHTVEVLGHGAEV